ACLDVMLEAEGGRGGTRRVVVRYEDLLEDWLGGIGRIGAVLDLPQLSAPDRERLAEVSKFVDPGLRRSRVGWDEVNVPGAVRDLAEGVWGQLQRLAAPDGDAAPVHDELDRMRAAYVALHDEAEAITQSSVTAVKPRKARRKARPPSLRARVVRRVPERYRVRLRGV